MTPATNTGTSSYDDQTLPLKKATRSGAIGLAAVAVLSCIGWYAADGIPGAWGAGLGSLIGGVFILVTVLLTLATAGKTAAVTGAVVLGGWLIKLLVLVAVMATLRPLDFYSRPALFATVCVVLVVMLAAETRAVLTTRTVYVGK
ncbi:hypothetical protein ACFSSC_06885 [Corynebacterium mendelii]|uniref:ATP synthase protein I n=1 Tax=Corynebacterium mendelii TaxID=2765362 RepID=A0A939IXX9_9CORY|nr:hypothetical protein [Corynebacterium mendelii]MBN9644945.1 hypothetical protein [Corynebacterium mendelii]